MRRDERRGWRHVVKRRQRDCSGVMDDRVVLGMRVSVPKCHVDRDLLKQSLQFGGRVRCAQKDFRQPRQERLLDLRRLREVVADDMYTLLESNFGEVGFEQPTPGLRL